MRLLLITLMLLFSTSIAKEIIYHPISHASFVIEADEEVIYVDPVGEKSLYEALPKPTLILITDIHGDHFAPTLVAEIRHEADVVLTKTASEKVAGIVMKNKDSLYIRECGIVAIPMYNLTKERLHFHEKGRGNGYVLTIGGKRIYISGDTEDISEMRQLKNIDDAFLCMNLPYTMTVSQAVSAVLAFKPRRVFPYHYRGKKDGERVFSDVKAFKSQVESKGTSSVILLDWYK